MPQQDDTRPIVVGGCYRSGTSLVRRLLDSHPRIHCGPEVKLFRDFYGDYLDVEDPIAHLRFLSTARTLLPAEQLLEVLGAAFVEMHERAARAAGKRRWADKVPENVVFLDEWQRILGDGWVFLHVVRNPLDTLASIEAQGGFPKSVPAGLDARIDLYVRYARAGLLFAERHPDRYVRLLYEDLVSAPTATAAALMSALGESFHPDQLKVNATAHQPGLEDPRAARATAIHRGGIDRWRRVLTHDEARLIARETAGVRSRLDPEGRWGMPEKTAAQLSPNWPVSQYWDTEEIPDYVRDLLATFRDKNPDLDHRVFSEVEAESFIADRIGSREAAAFRACAVPSMQSDYFRYCVVLALGGVYADADFSCAKPLRPLLEGLDRGEIFLSPADHRLKGRSVRRVWSQFFAFREPGHPFLRLALEIATANLEARIPERVWPVGEKVIESVWLTVGPGVPSLMRFIRDWGSFDAFLDAVAGTDAEPFGKLYCEVIGDYERIHEAFDGVRVSPAESMFHWVSRPDFPLPYKETDVHWQNVRARIFR